MNKAVNFMRLIKPTSLSFPPPLILFTTAFAVSLFYNGPGSGLYLLFACALLMIASFWTLQRKHIDKQQLKIPTDAISIVAYCYIAWLILNFAISSSNQLSGYLIWQFTSVPAAIVIWKLLDGQDERAWSSTWKVILILITLLSIYGWIQFFFNEEQKVQGSFSDPNTFACIINAVIAPIILKYLTQFKQLKQKEKLIYELILFSLIGVVIFTGSRTALVIFGAATFICIIISFWLKSLSFKSLLRLSLIIAVAMSIYSAASIEDKFNYNKATQSHSMKVRYLLWQSSFEIYKSQPLLGTGIGTFTAIYPSYRSHLEKYTSGHMVHNDYLQFLQEGGPIQLAFLVTAVIFTIFLFYKSLLRLKNSSSDTETTGLLIGVGSIFIHSLVNFNLYQLSVTLLLGLFLSRSSGSILGNHLSKLKLNFSKIILQIAFFVIFLIPLGGLFIDSISNLLFFPSKNDLFSGIIPLETKQRVQAAQKIELIRPKNYFTKNFLSQYYLSRFRNPENSHQKELLFQLVKHELQAQLTVFPQDYNAQKLLGQLHYEFTVSNGGSDFSEAIYHLKKSLQINPMHLPAYTDLAQIYFAQGKYSEAQYLLLSDAAKWFAMPQDKREHSYIPVLETAINLAEERGNNVDLINIADMLLHMNPENKIAKAIIEGQHDNQPGVSQK